MPQDQTKIGGDGNGELTDVYKDILKRVGNAAPPGKTPLVQEKSTLRGILEGTQENPPAITPGYVSESFLNSAFDFGKSLVNAIPHIAKSYIDFFNDPVTLKHVADHPEVVWEGIRDAGRNLANGLLTPYKEHGLRIFVDDPFTPLVDGLTLMSLGGGSLAKAGRLAEIAKIQGAAKAIKVGEAIERYPLQLAKAIIVKPIAKAVGIDLESLKAATNIKRERLAIANSLKDTARGEIRKLFTLPKPEEALLDKLIQEPTPLGLLEGAPQAVKNAYGYYSRHALARETRMVERSVITAEGLEAVKIKKLAIRKGITYAEAEKLYQAVGQRKPLYVPADSLENELSSTNLAKAPTEVQKSKVGFLEHLQRAKTGDIPKQYVYKAISQFIDFENTLGFIESLAHEGHIVPIGTRGSIPLANVVREGVAKRYLEGVLRPKALGIKGIIKESIAKGGLAESLKPLLEDKATIKYIKSLKSFAAKDPTIAKYIEWHFKRASGSLSKFLRFYDGIMGAFKFGVVPLNPSWYAQNAIGNPMLLAMSGELGLTWPVVRGMINSFPAQLRNGGKYIAAEIGWGDKFSNLSNAAQALDDVGRRAVWLKATTDNIKRSAAKFFPAYESTGVATRAIGESIDALHASYTEIQLLNEAIAKQTPQIVKLEAEITRLSSGMSLSNDIQEVTRFEQAISYASELRDQMLADIRDKSIRSGSLEVKIPKLRELAEISRDGIARGNALFGDYLGMHPFEQSVVRRIVPFWPFMKAMTKLAFTLPFTAPKTTFFWHRYAMAMASMVGDPELPAWTAGYFPVFARQDGSSVWIKLTSLGPTGVMRAASIFNMPIPQLFAFWEQNPFISLGMKSIGAKTSFYWATPPALGEPLVAINDGDMYEYKGNGEFGRTISQAPLFKTLFDSFPITQLVHQLIAGYDVRKGPVFNSDGTPKFPKELWETLLGALGPKTMIRSKEDIIRSDLIRRKKIFDQFRRKYRIAGPEDKTAIEEIFRDISKFGLPKIAKQ